ncbi:MAG: sigma-70 family RNA polymerase sigma factor, partial [Planctomycetes bacterium]|nr:sigma-70 family RNA polymerase sigma factor [Planctomycetota bacterium]
IYRVSLNTALTWNRNEKRKRKKFKTNVLDIQDLASNSNDNNDLSQNQQILNDVYDAMRKLSKSDSSIILLYLDGLSYDQISEVIGISKINVGVRLNRAKKKLAQLLKGLIDDF